MCNRFDHLVSDLALCDESVRKSSQNLKVQFAVMDTWLLNTNKIKHTVSMCDTNVKEEKKQTHVQMKENKKHMSYSTNGSYLKMMDIFQTTGQKINGLINLMHE
jgi:hypothetical protein